MAAFNLFRLYEQVGDKEGQIGALKQSIESNPRFPEGHLFLSRSRISSLAPTSMRLRGLQKKGWNWRRNREMAPLGHYVLADIYNRQGRPREAAQEAERGRELETRAKKKGVAVDRSQ